MSACEAYSIRPYTGDLKNGDFSICSTTAVVVCGAYSIRPYTNDLKKGDFSVHPTTGVAVCGAYAIRPYPTGGKFIRVLVHFYPGKEIMTGDSMDRHPRKGV